MRSWWAAGKVTRVTGGALSAPLACKTMRGPLIARALVSAAAGYVHRLFCGQIRSCSAVLTPSAKPVIAAKHPFEVDLEAGKLYVWCACGHSQKQPFCDGAHKKCAPEISPLKFKLEEGKKARLCGCKYTKNPPYCDGTHNRDFVQKADLHSQPQL